MTRTGRFQQSANVTNLGFCFSYLALISNYNLNLNAPRISLTSYYVSKAFKFLVYFRFFKSEQRSFMNCVISYFSFCFYFYIRYFYQIVLFTLHAGPLVSRAISWRSNWRPFLSIFSLLQIPSSIKDRKPWWLHRLCWPVRYCMQTIHLRFRVRTFLHLSLCVICIRVSFFYS